MKVLTSELANIALDWAVAEALGIETYGPEDFREQRKYTVSSCTAGPPAALKVARFSKMRKST